MSQFEEWQRVKAIFAAALEVDPESRERFVQELSTDEPRVATEVLSLLAADSDVTLLPCSTVDVGSPGAYVVDGCATWQTTASLVPPRETDESGVNRTRA